MSDDSAIEPGLLRRLRHTPMRDLFRGRVSGRLDLHHRIVQSGLPRQATVLIENLVRATGLWPLEKIEVADELIAHFADGLQSGQSMDELTKSFGDTRQAAKLIRRAQKRKRPLIWHALRALGWFVVAMVTLYIGLAIWFFCSHPTLSVNYVDVLNAPVQQSAPDQRAWPIYREALLAMGNRDADSRNALKKLLETQEDAKEWPEAQSWLKSHRDALALIREASQKPIVGALYGKGGSSNDPGLWPDLQPDQTTGADPLIGVLLPHLHEMNLMAQAMTDDAADAREQSDSTRFLSDIDAILAIAQQIRGECFLVSQILAVEVRLLALDQTDAYLTRSPQALNDTDLLHLAHSLARPDSSADMLDFGAERIVFRDMLQRMYTDDGHGDGHLTFEGLQMLKMVSSSKQQLALNLDPIRFATGPAAMVVVASRQETLQQYDRLMSIAEANLRVPIRDADWKAYDNAIDELTGSRTMKARYVLIAIMGPRLVNLHVAAERYLGQRDGILVGIALEAFRRQHGGKHPDSLSELAPLLLPSVPLDRIDGKPLRYRLMDGKPLVYSVGVDRDDDGGRLPVNRGGKADPLRAAQWDPAFTKTPADGDWVLYPQPRVPEDAN